MPLPDVKISRCLEMAFGNLRVLEHWLWYSAKDILLDETRGKHVRDTKHSFTQEKGNRRPVAHHFVYPLVLQG
jgi:hypothetical protein